MRASYWTTAYYILVAVLCVYWMFKSLGQVRTELQHLALLGKLTKTDAASCAPTNYKDKQWNR
jgi:hypothetical protein